MALCPMLKKECVKHQCEWYIQIMGKNPNTGIDVNQWGCAVSWLPTLVLEAAKESRHGAAATESFRNEIVKTNENFNSMLWNMAAPALDSKKTPKLCNPAE